LINLECGYPINSGKGSCLVAISQVCSNPHLWHWNLFGQRIMYKGYLSQIDNHYLEFQMKKRPWAS